MSDIADDILEIRNLILKNKHPSYLSTNKKEVHVRCPYCGDSKHDPKKARLYIEMQPPFRFHCFRCETSGILNNQTLRDLDIYNNDLNTTIINANKNFKANQSIQKVSYKKKTLINTPTQSELAQASVNYFNGRYGTKYTEEEIVELFKCVTDPLAFFKNNGIQVPKVPFSFGNAIGFISSDATHVIFRDISGKQKNRYFNLALCNLDEVTTSSKTYNIKTELDIMQPEVNLVITEGIFDIIGVYNHLWENKENTIFAAACGKAYNAVILNYIHMGFLNLNITIFSDGDVDISFYKALKANSPYLKNSRITVYYNSLYDPSTKYGKDYGVRKEDIKLRKIII